QAAGWDNVFRVARSPVAELAYRANLSPRDALTAHDAARLVTLRGIGTAHAAALIGSGVGSVEALAASDPDAVWEMVRAGGRGARRVPGAAIGMQAGDVEPGQPPLLQSALELRVQERAIGLFAEHHVAGLRCEPRDDLGVPRARHGVRRPLPELAVARRVGIGRVHDRDAGAPRRREQPAQGWDDALGALLVVRTAGIGDDATGIDKIVRHVDHD